MFSLPRVSREDPELDMSTITSCEHGEYFYDQFSVIPQFDLASATSALEVPVATDIIPREGEFSMAGRTLYDKIWESHSVRYSCRPDRPSYLSGFI